MEEIDNNRGVKSYPQILHTPDQSYVKNLLPDSIKGIIDILSTLRRGEGILLGDAVMMPTRIKITHPEPKPDTNDVSFTIEWSKPHSEIVTVQAIYQKCKKGDKEIRAIWR